MILNGNAIHVIIDGELFFMSECPKCGGTDIAIIFWGLPDGSEFLKEGVKRKKIVFGGCIVSKNNPELECNDCGWRYMAN